MTMLKVMGGGSDEDVYRDRKPGLERTKPAENTVVAWCPPVRRVDLLKIRASKASSDKRRRKREPIRRQRHYRMAATDQNIAFVAGRKRKRDARPTKRSTKTSGD
jgi:hypothetical protein